MEGLESLYCLLGPVLLAYLRRQVGDRGEAEELLQETFLVAARQSDSLAVAGSQRAWLFGIARNLVREDARRRTRRNMATLCEEPAAPIAERQDERIEAMRAAIERLPEAQREVLELRLSEELSYAEIAEALTIPMGTVRSRLHHAIAALRVALVAEEGHSTFHAR